MYIEKEIRKDILEPVNVMIINKEKFKRNVK